VSTQKPKRIHSLGSFARMEEEAEVTWDDQQHINKFGRLNNRLIDLKAELEQSKVQIVF
jgi:hypothetical protein